MNRLLLGAAHAALFALAACGEGGSSPQRTPLPIGDDAPSAYTLAWLQAHPDMIVQPEHLLIVPITPGTAAQSVDIHVREPMTLGIHSTDATTVLEEVTIEDARGTVQLRHRHGGDAASATLQPGEYRIVFKAPPGLTASQTLFLKLADTPSQAKRRLQAAAVPSGAGRGLLSAAAATPTPVGTISGNRCFNCSFDKADLSNQDLTDTFLGGSTFNFTTLTNTNFTRLYCYQCTFNVTADPGTLNFTDADLDSTLLEGNFSGVTFSGAYIMNSTLVLDFSYANFGPSATRPTWLKGSDLSRALLMLANIQYVDFTGANLRWMLTLYPYGPPQPGDLRGVKFDNVTPSNLFSSQIWWPGFNFAGFDLTDASFAGMDMSMADLSVAAGTKISVAGFAQAILSNGTTGANLADRDFGTQWTAWGGSADGTTPGADLRGVNLSNANLYQADLTRVRLDGANLVGAILSSSNLYRASLRGALLGVAPGPSTQSAATLDNAYMPLADLSYADLRSVNFSSVHLYTLDGVSGVSLAYARLDAANFSGAFMMGADLSATSLNDTNFDQAMLTNVKFSGAQMVNTKLTHSSLQGADFTGVTGLVGIDLTNAMTSNATGSVPFTDLDQIQRTYGFGATVLGPLLTSSGVICPNGSRGPCTGSDSLNATPPTPYPPAPQCVGLKKYHYENCDPGWTPPDS